MQRTLIGLGIALVLVGLFWPYLARIPIGRLPGDIIINKPQIKIYIPVTTMILVSVVISLIMWLLRK